jgi:hypothetical protein
VSVWKAQRPEFKTPVPQNKYISIYNKKYLNAKRDQRKN